MMNALRSTTEVRESQTYNKDINVTDIQLDLRSQYSPQDLPTSADEYPQVFEDRLGFQSGLSIIDLLMNTGPEAALFF